MTDDEIVMKLIGGAVGAAIVLVLLGLMMWTVVLPGIGALWLAGGYLMGDTRTAWLVWTQGLRGPSPRILYYHPLEKRNDPQPKVLQFTEIRPEDRELPLSVLERLYPLKIQEPA